jgi:hypothetical protein
MFMTRSPLHPEAGLRDAFDTRRNIHTVAHPVVALDHDVANMNADAERQAP